MVDVFDPVIQTNKAAIDLLGQSPVVLAIRILVELVGIPKPSRCHSGIMGCSNQLRLHNKVNTA